MCDTTPCELFPTFRKIKLPSFAETKRIFYLNYLTLKEKALQYFEPLGTTHPTTRRHMPQDLHLEQHLCANAKSCTLLGTL